MEDAGRKKPVCNDQYARRFMDENGMKIFEPFKTLTMPNIWNVIRCRIIDDLLGKEIEKNRNINVITIGAGFDTRPYRLSGGVWAEIDEPQFIH
jgi:O-methyltransferase involved in polyketide biosynthesis